MKKAFIDVGFNVGQSLIHFLDIVPDACEYDIHVFEPDSRNFNSFNSFVNNNIHFHKEVVWTHDGVIKFYIGDNSFSSSTMCNKTTGINPCRYVESNCIDISRFLRDNYSDGDYVILKLDIEGGEYDVLRHLIDDGGIKCVTDLFVEFHHNKLKGVDEKHHIELVNELKQLGFLNAEVAWEVDSINLNMLSLYK